MDWFKDLYDEFRMQRGFGSIPDEKTKEEVDFIVNVLNLFEGSRVLDLFCGIGRHSIELAKRGCKPVGIEYNPEYLNLAREKAKMENITVEFIQGDVRSVDFRTEYNAVIIMHQSFGYFSDEEDRMVLQNIYKVLKQNGRFLIEILSKDWILQHFVEREVIDVNGIRVEEIRKFDAVASRINFKTERYLQEGIVTKQGSWRIYSASEMTGILEDIGFKYVAGYNDLDKTPLTKNTRLMRLVFER